MRRSVIGRSSLLVVISFCLAASWATAADPFVGSWTSASKDATARKRGPMAAAPGQLGESFKIETYKNGYRFTHDLGSWTADFVSGVAAWHDVKGNEVVRMKVVRKSDVEIEFTEPEPDGVKLVFRILPGGNDMEFTWGRQQGGGPGLTAHYKRTS